MNVIHPSPPQVPVIHHSLTQGRVEVTFPRQRLQSGRVVEEWPVGAVVGGGGGLHHHLLGSIGHALQQLPEVHHLQVLADAVQEAEVPNVHVSESLLHPTRQRGTDADAHEFGS